MEQFKINEIQEKLKKAKSDTTHSKRIFALEEGKEDDNIQRGISKGPRRDWLIIADIYGGTHTQKFHLENYVNFKWKNKQDDTISFSYIRNGALLLYIYEEILNKRNAADALYTVLLNYYSSGGAISKFKSTDEYIQWAKKFL